VSVSGSGGDVWGTADRGYFLSTPIAGNFTLTARIVSLAPAVQGETLTGWAKAGIMARQGTEADARNAFIALSPGNGVSFQYRTATAGTSSSSNQGGLAAPYWVRLIRSGNTLRGLRSPDGVTWTQQGSNQTVTITDPVRVGFAASANTATSAQPVATFDNITGLPAFNAAPSVDPGTAPAATEGEEAALSGSAGDDGQPGALVVQWTKMSGPGSVVFGNATAAVTGVTFGEPGTYVLRLTATDGDATVFEDLAVTVESAADFASWIEGYPEVGSETAPEDDPDGDGLQNLMEYALGGNPSLAGGDPVPATTASTVEGLDYLTMTIPRNPDTEGITWIVEVCSELGGWVGGPPHTVVVSDTATELVVRDATPMGNAPRRFIRLRISQP